MAIACEQVERYIHYQTATDLEVVRYFDNFACKIKLIIVFNEQHILTVYR
jgi:hypothetical protein